MNLFARVHATALGARLVPAADGATHTVLTPRALRSLLDEGTPPPPHVTVAGDRCDPVLSRRAREAGADVGHYYGAAELSFVAWGPHAEDLRAFPEVAIEVIDGEVWVDSPFVADRYDDGDLRRRGRQVTAGDRGVLEDGRLRLLGRDDVVVTGGATVRIADVESALGDGVVAVGVPDASWGEVLAAVVPGDADVSMLRERARSALSSAQRPRLWFRMETLPSTAAGKTDRRALAALIASGGVPRIAVVP
jgi:acyl-coenzyme A synthetase/AMP-(fatty) acid ligase